MNKIFSQKIPPSSIRLNNFSAPYLCSSSFRRLFYTMFRVRQWLRSHHILSVAWLFLIQFSFVSFWGCEWRFLPRRASCSTNSILQASTYAAIFALFTWVAIVVVVVVSQCHFSSELSRIAWSKLESSPQLWVVVYYKYYYWADGDH